MSDQTTFLPPSFYLSDIHLQNFRCFEDLKMTLHPRMNVLVGANASGKTNFLQGIRPSLWSLVSNVFDGNQYARQMAKDQREKYDFVPSDIHTIDYSFNQEKTKQVITTLKCNIQEEIYILILGSENIAYQPSNSRFMMLNINSLTTREHLRKWNSLSQSIHNKVKNNVKGSYLPLFGYYDVNRLFLTEKEAMQSDHPEEASVYGSRFLGYKDCLYSGLNMAHFESWMKKQTFIELQEKQMKGIAESAELSLIRNALKSCIPNFETIYYDLRIEKVVYKEKEKGQMPLTFLSAGQKGILLMVVDMALKCIRLNPELREKANETPGTVLIDEIELHLHPSWQRIVLPGLSKALYPSAQPHIFWFLGSC